MLVTKPIHQITKKHRQINPPSSLFRAGFSASGLLMNHAATGIIDSAIECLPSNYMFA